MANFNNRIEEVDAALKSHADALATAGNCSITVSSYTGTGDAQQQQSNCYQFFEKTIRNDYIQL